VKVKPVNNQDSVGITVPDTDHGLSNFFRCIKLQLFRTSNNNNFDADNVITMTQ